VLAVMRGNEVPKAISAFGKDETYLPARLVRAGQKIRLFVDEARENLLSEPPSKQQVCLHG
jgi:hypothetical protein